MQPQPATPRTSTYRLEHADSRLCIRLHCAPTPAGEPPRIVPQLSRPAQASRFPSHDAAILVAQRYLPHIAVEIVRVDA